MAQPQSTFLTNLRTRYLYSPNDREKWFFKLAELAAERSRDPRTHVGAVVAGPDFVIRSVGWNDLPRGVNDTVDERRVQPLKGPWTEHAERNALYNAARTGVGTTGCFMFAQTFPCAECARGVIQTGIVRLYTYFPDWDPDAPFTKEFPMNDWRRQTPEVVKMLHEAKVDLRLLERPPIEFIHNTVSPKA